MERERDMWAPRADSWENEGSSGLTDVVAAVLERCHTDGQTIAVDLGCGSGQVTLPLAPGCRRVLAVDVSSAAIEILDTKAKEAGIGNIEAIAGSIQELDLEQSSLDLVVTNYALHHLDDADKRALLGHAFGWLRPGGQLVIGDMMLGRGNSSGDRAIVAAKVKAMVRRGPAGWWRILKNLWRFSMRVQEKPLPVPAWEALVQAAGFGEVRTDRIVQEACVLAARKPAVSAS